MKQMKFCANISFLFTEYNFVERYAQAKKFGFSAVESGFPYGLPFEDVVNAKKNAGINQVLLNIYTGDVTKGELGFASVPGKEKEFVESLDLTIKYAKALNCPMIHIMSGLSQNDSQELDNVYESNLRLSESKLRSADIIGLIEPINRYTVPKYYLHNYQKALQLVKNINSPHIRLMADLFHMQQIQGNLIKSLQSMLDSVGHIQIAQVPDRHEPNTAGEINYKYVLNQLEIMGYKDWIGLEYKPANPDTTQGLSWINDFGYKL